MNSNKKRKEIYSKAAQLEENLPSFRDPFDEQIIDRVVGKELSEREDTHLKTMSA